MEEIGMQTKKVDYIVIGGGSGGIASANRAAERGASVLLFEPNQIGGTCVNVGCVPKKVTWQAANLILDEKLAPDYGFSEPAMTLNFDQFVANRSAYIDRLHTSYFNGLDHNGVVHLKQAATFADGHTVESNGERYTASHILIATGSRPNRPDIVGGNLGITSEEFFSLTKLPKRITVVGSGYIATEFAGLLHLLGSDVTILSRHQSLLPTFDQIISENITAQYRDSVSLLTEDEAVSVKKVNGALEIKTQSGRTVETDQIIWAIGRTPYTASLNLEKTNVQVDEAGAITVDKYQKTTADGIYAVWDVVNLKNLTPAAITAGRRLSERLFNQQANSYLDYSQIPTVVFTHPEIGSVGLTEAEAVHQFGAKQVRVYESNFTPMRDALSESSQKSHFKLVCAGADERVVGLHGIGEGMSELLQGFSVAIRMGATKQDFDQTVAIHPTQAEEFVTMRGGRAGKGS